MNTIQEVGNQLHCSCGAKADPKDKNRFLKRHPIKCISKEIIPKLESTKPPLTKDVYLNYLEKIEQGGKNLSDWEKKFIKDMRTQINLVSTKFLSENQKNKLEQIYSDKTPL